jgi:hypothetical protein
MGNHSAIAKVLQADGIASVKVGRMNAVAQLSYNDSSLTEPALGPVNR